MELYSKILLLVLSSLIGAGLGFIAQSYFNKLRFRQSTTESIVKRYLDARDELCTLVAECAVNANSQDSEWLNRTLNSISLSYYKFFDYMPKLVIKEMICLQACLKGAGKILYKLEGENLCPIESNDLENFCRNIATLENIAYALYFNLHNGSEEKLCNHRIEYQARQALMNINKHFTEKNLTSLSLFRPKGHKTRHMYYSPLGILRHMQVKWNNYFCIAK
ncbi:MAG: hypothetical protein HY951_04535 [Bacteroidia bacterium]|nr:hypothetical protein [Bacteroidia bacterium]